MTSSEKKTSNLKIYDWAIFHCSCKRDTNTAFVGGGQMLISKISDYQNIDSPTNKLPT